MRQLALIGTSGTFITLPGTWGQRDGSFSLALGERLAKVETFWQVTEEYLWLFLSGVFWHLQGNKS